MVSSWTYILTFAFFAIIIYAIYKKPEVLKKDSSKPLSIKNFSLKKTFIGDWKQFGTWILLMYIVWSYAYDTKNCRELIENTEEYCMNYTIQLNQNRDGTNVQLNLGGDDGNSRDTRSLNQQRGSNLVP